MTTTIGTQFRPVLDMYGHTEKEHAEPCNWIGCENESTHWGSCPPEGNGCGKDTPWCVDHVLEIVSRRSRDPQHQIRHGKHNVFSRLITWVPKK